MEIFILNITDIIRKLTDKDASYSKNNAIEDIVHAHLNELGKKTFKVQFLYQKDRIGRLVEFNDVHVFDVYNSIELHQKINDYMREKYNDLGDRWHYPIIIGIDEI